MNISSLLSKESVIAQIKSSSKPEVLIELSNKISETYNFISKEKLLDALIEREKLCSTAIDSGVAIPHCKLEGIPNIIVGLGRSTKGIDFESLDGKKTHIFFLLIAPENSVREHIKLLSRISKLCKDKNFRSNLLQLESENDLYDYILSQDNKIKDD